MKKLISLLLFPLTVCSQSADSLLKVLESQSPADTAKVSTYYALAHLHWLHGEDSLAKKYCYDAITLAKKLGYPEGESNARFQLVRIEMDLLSETDAAYAHLDTVDRQAEASGNELIQGISYFRRAQLISMTNMERSEPIDSLLNLALSLFKKKNTKYWESLVYAEKAGMLGWDGKYAQAIDMLLKARTLQESLNDEKTLRATLPNLGVTYIQVEMYREALECFDQAEKIAHKNNDVRILAFIYNQKGDIYKKQGELQKALDSYSSAAEIYRKTNSNQFLPSAYARMSDIYFKMGRYDDALRFNLQSDSIFHSSNGKNSVYHLSQINFGNIYLRKGDYAAAIRTALDGLTSIREVNSLLFEESSYHRQLSEAYSSLGRYKPAYEHLLKYKEVSDSLFNDESRQKILASTMTYEFDKMKSAKDMEIQQLENRQLMQTRNILLFTSIAGLCLLVYILRVNRRLKKYNRDLLHKNREIEMALDRGQKIERRRVASELHDNLNTKLAALRWSLESMDTANWDNTNQSLHKKLLDMANDAYKDVRLISHNMLPPELEREGLPAAFGQLVRKLNELGDIHFTFREDNLYRRLSKNEEHQLYNIALEAINNVLKHAEARNVNLTAIIRDNVLTLTIADDGKGIENTADRKGMGIHNIKNRAESIGGEIHIDSAPREGTTVTVTVPLAP